MYELLVAGMNWYDIINKGSRSAGTTGTPSFEMQIVTASLALRPSFYMHTG